MLAIAYTYARDHRAAQALYLGLSGMYAENPVVWLGVLGEIRCASGDVPAAQRADSVSLRTLGRRARARSAVFVGIWRNSRT
mgnify:CR=1 FL=1